MSSSSSLSLLLLKMKVATTGGHARLMGLMGSPPQFAPPAMVGRGGGGGSRGTQLARAHDGGLHRFVLFVNVST